MKRKVHFDFETGSAADIKEVGAYLYIKDPSTFIMCAAFAVDNGPVYILKGTPDQWDWEVAAYLYELACDEETVFVAHNAQFEQDAWEELMPDSFPRIPVNRWRCTMAKCYAHSLPGSLEMAGKVLNLEQQKDKRGEALLKKLGRPKKDGTFYTYDEAPEDFEALYEYNGQDTETERCLDHRLRDLSAEEQRVWELDQIINRRGLHVDIPVIERVIEYKEEATAEVVAEFRELTGLNPTQRQKVKEWLQANYNLSVPDMQAPTLAKVIDACKDKKLAHVLTLYGKANLSSLAKFETMLNRADREGVIREAFAYHGAHTGRWAGRGVQFQNMKRPNEAVDINVCLDAIMTLTLDEFKGWYGE